MNISPALRERIIIAADDYGIRRSAAPLLKLAQAGKIDRVAVMVNYVSQEAARELLETGVKIDIHLDLIKFLGRGETPGEGTLFRGLAFLGRLCTGGIPIEKVELDWRNQIEKFQSLFGRLPDGINSHEHVHYFPPFFKKALCLAQAFHIPYVRFGKKEMLLHLHHSLIGRILETFSFRNRKPFEAAGLESSDYVIGFDWLSDFETFLARVPEEGSLEIIFHPERPDEFRFIETHF